MRQKYAAVFTMLSYQGHEYAAVVRIWLLRQALRALYAQQLPPDHFDPRFAWSHEVISIKLLRPLQCLLSFEKPRTPYIQRI